jgi:S-DNA-T family DNA segregation ATPase FtsK/SpoIIIE
VTQAIASQATTLSVDPQFGFVRFGVGRSALSRAFDNLPTLGRPEDYEPVTYQALSAFLERQNGIDGIAKPVSLRAIPGLALVAEDDGEMEPVYALARSIICQATVFHSPNDLKLMIVTDDIERWDWVKWLPHTQHSTLLDTAGTQRMVWTSAETFNAVMGDELHDRGGFTKPSTQMPHWLVINDQKRLDETYWQTLTRLDGVAGVTFIRLAAERGTTGLEFRSTYRVSPRMIRDASGPFAVPDQMNVRTARTIARRMAGWRPDAATETVVADEGGAVKLDEMLGITDFANLDTERLWAPTRSGPPFEESPWGDRWLRIPYGRDELGNEVYIDFKEPHEGGMGHHMALVGTTGSGKSEFWCTLLLSACLTHSPESLNIAFFDFKGATTAQAIEHLPHTVAAMNNLKDDVLWLERMSDVLYGELEIRKRMLNRAKVGNAAEYEYLRIHRGEALPPMPTLLVVVDEFTQMFKESPAAKDVFDEIGRQGRALAVKMLMGSQRLGNEMGQGIMANVPIRGALRVLDGQESRLVLGTEEAAYLPDKPAGAGYLNVQGRKELTRFRTAYVSGTYVRPRQVVASAVRAQSGYVQPREFLVTGMAAVSRPTRQEKVDDRPQVMIGSDGRAMRDIQVATQSLLAQAGNRRGRRMWLPPLTPLPVDELVRRLRGKPWYVDYGQNPGLVFPVGVEDRPFHHRQPVYTVNMLSGNCGVIGVGDAGKTVAVTTMIAGAALMYTPQRIQFYVISFSGADINEVEALPHVGSFARGNETERVTRTLAELETLIEDRELSFRELGIGMEQLRERKFGGQPGPVPDDPYGDVFLVLDGWANFVAAYDDQGLSTPVDRLVRIMAKGPNYGVHVIVSAHGWISGKLRSGMRELMTSNVELRLNLTGDELTTNSRDVAIKVPFGEREVADDDATIGAAGGGEMELGESEHTKKILIRGRGTSMAGYHFQTGLPQISVEDRVVRLGEAADWINKVAGVDAAKLKILPERITLKEVLAQANERGEISRNAVPFGISEIGLRPALAEFASSPHLLLAGDRECGVSTGLASIARAIMAAYSPEEAEIFVVDPHTGLAQVVEGPHLGVYVDQPAAPKDEAAMLRSFGVETPDVPVEPPPVGKPHPGYVHREDQIRSLGAYLGSVLAQRLPEGDLTQAQIAAGLRWPGRQIFVIVDREETLQEWASGNFMAGAYPLEPVMQYVSRGLEVGLHLVVGRRIGTWARAAGSPLVDRLLRMKSPGVVMSGDKSEGAIIGSQKATKMPPGRGVYVTDKVTAPVQIAMSGPER